MNHISKKVAFLGFLGLLLSNAPVRAQDVPGAPTPAFFEGWGDKALDRRTGTVGKSIQNGLRNLRACLLGKKECSRGKIIALRGALATLTAIIAVAAAEKWAPLKGKPSFIAYEAGLAAEIAAEKARGVAEKARERAGELSGKLPAFPFKKHR